jgi:hypothetical protein
MTAKGVDLTRSPSRRAMTAILRTAVVSHCVVIFVRRQSLKWSPAQARDWALTLERPWTAAGLVK